VRRLGEWPCASGASGTQKAATRSPYARPGCGPAAARLRPGVHVNTGAHCGIGVVDAGRARVEQAVNDLGALLGAIPRARGHHELWVARALSLRRPARALLHLGAWFDHDLRTRPRALLVHELGVAIALSRPGPPIALGVVVCRCADSRKHDHRPTMNASPVNLWNSSEAEYISLAEL
jgi:hypothetical protein